MPSPMTCRKVGDLWSLSSGTWPLKERRVRLLSLVEKEKCPLLLVKMAKRGALAKRQGFTPCQGPHY